MQSNFKAARSFFTILNFIEQTFPLRCALFIKQKQLNINRPVNISARYEAHGQD